MHPVQQHILKRLTSAKSLRYAELKPPAVESNRFTYHLNTLIGQRYVGKHQSGYQLTAPGKRYVDKLSLKGFYPRTQPKIVTVIIFQNEKGEVLTYRRKQQPFIGKYVFPYGKIHIGENIQEAALRELQEKTGLHGSLTHRGEAYLLARERGELVSHMLCHVFSGKSFTGAFAEHPFVEDLAWRQLTKNLKQDFFPGFLNLFEAVQNSKRHFFVELPLQ